MRRGPRLPAGTLAGPASGSQPDREVPDARHNPVRCPRPDSAGVHEYRAAGAGRIPRGIQRPDPSLRRCIVPGQRAGPAIAQINDRGSPTAQPAKPDRLAWAVLQCWLDQLPLPSECAAADLGRLAARRPARRLSLTYERGGTDQHPAGLEATRARRGRLPGTAGGRAGRRPRLAGREPDRARRPSPDSWCPLVTDLRLFPRRPGGGNHDGMTAIATSYESLLKVRKGAVDIVDVPEFGFVAVTGTGAPGGAEFTEAVQALYSVSYGAHFRLKKLTGEAPRVMPLEGLWWVDDPAQQDIVAAVARGEVTMAGSDRGSWRWQALIMQPDPIDAGADRRRHGGSGQQEGPARPGPPGVHPVGGGPVRSAAAHRAVRRRGAIDRGPARGHRGSGLPPPRPPSRDLPQRPAPQRAGEAADDHPASRRAGLRPA